MLRRTFLHIPRVGESTERKLWAEGLSSWEDLARSARHAALRPAAEESIARYAAKDWAYFEQHLPTAHKWRAFGDLGSRAVYVDIETAGGVEAEDLTVIGTYDGRTVRSFVAGRDLDAAREYLEQFPLMVTFNGATFDLPFIRRRFPYNLFRHMHVDLRFALQRLGYKGGLKRIEHDLGIARSAATRGLDGWDAVRLWRDWQRGHEDSLELLLAYNAEDVRNLKPLMEFVHREMTALLPQRP